MWNGQVCATNLDEVKRRRLGLGREGRHIKLHYSYSTGSASTPTRQKIRVRGDVQAGIRVAKVGERGHGLHWWQ